MTLIYCVYPGLGVGYGVSDELCSCERNTRENTHTPCRLSGVSLAPFSQPSLEASEAANHNHGQSAAFIFSHTHSPWKLCLCAITHHI